ncbi:MAG: DNA topoisomerase I, partial [Cyclobacteriaceae bacterium]|nr:DNA topoisomerase I [Cyclobacteriaceae bacterium]
SMDEAMELFKLPRDLGEFEGEIMTANVGRFGPYIRHKGKFVSLRAEQDPLSVTSEEAIELILDKRSEDANKYIKTFDEDPEVFVLKGRFGPYIKFGTKNVKIPKGQVPEELTFEQCKELAEKTPAATKKGGRRKTKK